MPADIRRINALDANGNSVSVVVMIGPKGDKVVLGASAIFPPKNVTLDPKLIDAVNTTASKTIAYEGDGAAAMIAAAATAAVGKEPQGTEPVAP